MYFAMSIKLISQLTFEFLPMRGAGVDVEQVGFKLQARQHGRHAHVIETRDAENNQRHALTDHDT